ncbi:MAG: prepilin-type N-terminal cleavage/methylation domain-containing protein [Syntrophales bacterium]|nr:prepilin-type N-terminal cleavage/methylation domain-containing protein [Syntrophales bacterium]
MKRTGIKKEISLRQKGFTFIEIIAVIVVLGIVAVVAVGVVLSQASFALYSEMDILKSHLRFVQYRALSDNVPWSVRFDGNSYTVLRDGEVWPHSLPNEDSSTHALPSGYSVSGTTVIFDEWGSPGDSDISITLSGGGGSQSIRITKHTGFIQ